MVRRMLTRYNLYMMADVSHGLVELLKLVFLLAVVFGGLVFISGFFLILGKTEIIPECRNEIF